MKWLNAQTAMEKPTSLSGRIFKYAKIGSFTKNIKKNIDAWTAWQSIYSLLKVTLSKMHNLRKIRNTLKSQKRREPRGKR